MDEGSAFLLLAPSVPSPPLPPRAAPSLAPRHPTLPTELSGSYDISFGEAEPDSDGLVTHSDPLPLSAALVRIEDDASDHVEYIWLVRVIVTLFQYVVEHFKNYFCTIIPYIP